MKSYVKLSVAALAAAAFLAPASTTFAAMSSTSPAAKPAASTAQPSETEPETSPGGLIFGHSGSQMPVTDLIKVLGMYDQAHLDKLTDAKGVTVFHVAAVYPLPQLLKLENAIGKNKMMISTLQKKVAANKEASTWFKDHNIDLSKLLVVVVKDESISVYES